VYVFEDNFLRYIDLIVGYFKPYPVVGARMENQTLPSRPQQIGFQVFLETSNPIDVFASDSGWMTGYPSLIELGKSCRPLVQNRWISLATKYLHVRSRSYRDHEKPSGSCVDLPGVGPKQPRSRLRISHGISSLWAGEFHTTHSKLQPDFAETCILDNLAQKT